MCNEIQKNIVYLAENLANLLLILLHLRQRNIISKYEEETILSKNTSLERNNELLGVLGKRNWVEIKNVFLEILRDTHNEHCADKIQGVFSRNYEQNVGHPKTLNSKWWPEKHFLIKPFHLENLASKMLVEELHETILNDTNRMVVITESEDTWKYFQMGGGVAVGKTLTAKWYAHHYEEEYDHILWIDCGEGCLVQSFQKLARDLKVEDYDRLVGDEDYARKSYEKLTAWKCLLIFDNVINYEGILKVLPKYKENFYCLITSRRKEGGIKNFGYLKISFLELDIVTDKENLQLLKFIDAKLGTRVTKFNYATCLHKNARLEECVEMMKPFFTRRNTKETQFTETIETIFAYLENKKLKINIENSKLLYVEREPSQIQIGTLLLYSYLQLEKNEEAMAIAKQIINNVGHLIQMISVTHIPNYHLECVNYKVKLNLDTKTKSISLSKCSLDLSSFDRICPDELTLESMSFTRNGEKIKEVTVNTFLDLHKINRLSLNDEKISSIMCIDLSEQVFMEQLQLRHIRVLDWKTANWDVQICRLEGIHFVENTKMKIREIMEIVDSSLDISFLPQATQKLNLKGSKVVVNKTNGIDLPHLKYLKLVDINSSFLSLFQSIRLNQIHLNRIDKVNADLLPESVQEIKIASNKRIYITGTLRKVNKLILDKIYLEQIQEYLSHFQTEILVVYVHGIRPNGLLELMKTKIKTIAVGRINWKQEENFEILTKLAALCEFYWLEGGKWRGMEEREFEKLTYLNNY